MATGKKWGDITKTIINHLLFLLTLNPSLNWWGIFVFFLKKITFHYRFSFFNSIFVRVPLRDIK